MRIISKIIEIFITPDFKKEAKKIVESEEYQNTLKEMTVSTKALNDINKKLKVAVDERLKADAEARRLGIDVKPYKTIDELVAQHRGHNSLLERYKSKQTLLKCIYCNGQVQSDVHSQFCSIKCEKEYRDFKTKG